MQGPLAVLACALFGLHCPEDPTPPIGDASPDIAASISAPSIAMEAVKPAKMRAGFPFDPECRVQPPQELEPHFVAAARVHPGPTDCELALQAFAESSFRVDAVSPAGAIGVSQFMPATAEEFGIDPWDPRESIMAQAEYVIWCRARWDPEIGGRTDFDIRALGLGCYNHGAGNMYRSRREHGWNRYHEARPVLPGETVDYVRKIEGR